MAAFETLSLRAFRNYASLDLHEIPGGMIALTGPNGSGKTNLLEALSLFVPGRGLRGSETGEIQNTHSPDQAWQIAANWESFSGAVRLSTYREPGADKRKVRINGAEQSQSALGEWLTLLWLTPAMDTLFRDAPGTRRRFFDRMTASFDPAHTGRLTRYDNAMRQRNKILQEAAEKGRNPDPAWLTAIEIQMAETGTAIAAARLHFLEKLNRAAEEFGSEDFPAARLSPLGQLEEDLARHPALHVEEGCRKQLEHSRPEDMKTGVTSCGPHRTDIAVAFDQKNIPASRCSTGEQKALLIGIVLAQAELVRRGRGFAPPLLLDEVAAHLDPDRRQALFQRLRDLGSQIWMTGTEPDLFKAPDIHIYKLPFVSAESV